MLQKLSLVFLMFIVLLVVSTNHIIAGNNFSKDKRENGDLSLQEAKNIYKKATTLDARVEAYEDLRRFEPVNMEEIEKSLALSLASSFEEEHRKLAVALYGRALIAKEKFDPHELAPFCRILNSLLSLTNQVNLIKEYMHSYINNNVKQIRATSFKLLELLKDIPEGCEVIFSASADRLGMINPNENLLLFRLLVERKNMWHPAIINYYIYLLEQSRKKIPLPEESIVDLYKTMLEDYRFRAKEDYIFEYTRLCHKNKRFEAAKGLLVEVLEENDFSQEAACNLQYALALSYTKLKEHEKAIEIIEKIISLSTNKEFANLCCFLRIYNLYELGNSEKAKAVLQEIMQNNLSHLLAQRDKSKAEQRKKYVEAIKFDLARKEKEDTAQKVSNANSSQNIEKRESVTPLIVSEEGGDFFLDGTIKQSSRSNKNTTHVKLKTRKQANIALNTKRNAPKFKEKGEKEVKKEERENLDKRITKYRNAEELPNSSYKTLVEIFSIFVGEAKWGSCKITVEEVGHLFETLGHTYSKTRGHGGHSMILCNKGKKEEDAGRKAFTFGSKKKLHPAAIVDIALFLLEYRIYPKHFEGALKEKDLL